MKNTIGNQDIWDREKQEATTSDSGVWRELDLSGMGIRNICPEIRLYSHITALYLNNNQLTQIPEQLLLDLPLLSTLDLSYNKMKKLPKSVGHLALLEKLLLKDNQLFELPSELGNLSRLQEIDVSGNPLIAPPAEIVQAGTKHLLSYLHQQTPFGVPPERKYISYIDPSVSIPNQDKLKVLSYNILSDSYVSSERYSYCPSWVLDWSFRKRGILRELLTYDCDIICLQEVQAKDYNNFFQPSMERAGYSGIFAPKSRARTMEDWGIVDGCVIFFKSNRFQMVEKHIFEYQAIAMAKHKEFSQDSDAFSRLITKDNVGLLAILQMKDNPSQLGLTNGKTPQPRFVLVANTHIHWDPEQCDVKLMQVQFLLEQIALVTSPKSKWHRIPMIVCGDFNSGVASGPYELLQRGRLDPNHPDFQQFNYGTYSKHGLRHPLQLRSAYAPIGEPPFTNYTDTFVGVLDYLWYSWESFSVSKVLQPVEEEVVRESCLPNTFMHSDHVSILSEFYFRTS